MEAGSIGSKLTLSATEKILPKVSGEVKPDLLKGLDSLIGNGREIKELNQVLSKDVLNPKELIACQIKASNYHLRIELVSKVAESVMSTARKLQNNT